MPQLGELCESAASHEVSVDGVSMPIGIWSAGWDSIKRLGPPTKRCFPMFFMFFSYSEFDFKDSLKWNGSSTVLPVGKPRAQDCEFYLPDSCRGLVHRIARL